MGQSILNTLKSGKVRVHDTCAISDIFVPFQFIPNEEEFTFRWVQGSVSLYFTNISSIRLSVGK